MAILSGFFKTKKYRKTTDGYKLESNWTSGNTVELDDGNTVQNNLGAIKGITTSTSVTEQGYAADATTVAALNESLESANTNISKKQDASTAITTSNIGSQSVNYANSSNYANSAGSANAATKAYQDGNGADIASTYLKGTQNNGDFINRPSVNISGTICGLIPTYRQNSQGYPVVGLYIQPGTERLIIDWYADGNIIKSYIVTGRA